MDFFDFHHHKKNYTFGIYNLNIGDTAPDVLYSIGIHPQDICRDQLKFQFNWLQSEITSNCFAIGECGLDSLVNVDEETQKNVFLRQINLSNEIKKPLIIHCVRKYYEIISLSRNAQQAMIIHGFNKKQKIAIDLLENKLYLSFGKAVLYNLSLQHTIKFVPIDKLFLETDDSDFNISELYQKVSELKNISLEQLHNQIKENLETISNG
ncbi:TatD family hydrolase [Chryseobacterium sp.]|uniref:TatD family hydrolase n=1 Tax=Chryseobacterium sp. TaxID=1871047 RepID=UPI00388F5B8C